MEQDSYIYLLKHIRVFNALVVVNKGILRYRIRGFRKW